MSALYEMLSCATDWLVTEIEMEFSLESVLLCYTNSMLV